MAEAQFISHSGASQVSANAFELRLDEHRILLDCGATSRTRPPFIDAVAGVDAIWLSHAHWDHIGALSHAVAGDPRVPVLATRQTAALLPFALKAAWGNDPRGAQRGVALAKRVQAISELQYHTVSSDPTGAQKVPRLKIMAFPAGHILGAAMVLVEWDHGGPRPFRALYTGDFCTHDQTVIQGALIPRTGVDFEIDAVIIEGILGTDLEADTLEYGDEARRLTRDLQATKGPRLVAVAPVGEALEALVIMMREGLKPYVHDWLRPLFDIWHEQYPEEISALEGRFIDTPQARLLLGGGQIVVAAGEQLQLSSTAGQLALEIAHLDDGLIAVFNRISPNTPAGIALRAPRNREVDWKGRRLTLRAQLGHYRLFNHAPRWQILETLKALNPRQVLFVHGKAGALHALGRSLTSAGFSGEVTVPVNKQVVSLL